MRLFMHFLTFSAHLTLLFMIYVLYLSNAQRTAPIPLPYAFWMSWLVCDWDWYSSPGQIDLGLLRPVKEAPPQKGQGALVAGSEFYARAIQSAEESAERNPDTTKTGPIIRRISLHAPTVATQGRINADRRIYLARAEYVQWIFLRPTVPRSSGLIIHGRVAYTHIPNRR